MKDLGHPNKRPVVDGKQEEMSSRVKHSTDGMGGRSEAWDFPEGMVVGGKPTGHVFVKGDRVSFCDNGNEAANISRL